MIDFSKAKHSENPFPYFELDRVFDDFTFDKLLNEFPDVSDAKTVMGGRKKIENLSENGEVLNYPTWKSLYDSLNTQTTFNFIKSRYENEFRKWGSDFLNKSDISDCYVHLDWSVATDGYTREIHRDSDKRVWNFIIFLNDKNWEGGDFVIHSSEKVQFYKEHFWRRKLPVSKTFTAKQNTGVFFLSTPNSYHSVSFQHNSKTDRRFVYGSLSLKEGKCFHRSFRSQPNYLRMAYDYYDEIYGFRMRLFRWLGFTD